MTLPHARPASAAFTLLEMAVVLAIIGMLVGGVLATQSYLRTSKLTTTVNQTKFYLNAAEQFQRIYGGSYPGDMANATDYWGDSGGCPGSTGTGTCNGNGDNVIGPISGDYREVFLVFQHLQKAGLITGIYTGVTGPASAVDFVVTPNTSTTNAPTLAISDVGITLITYGGWNSSTALYDGFYNLTAIVGKDAPNYTDGAFMSGKEAYELDMKFDNGSPATGWLRTIKSRTDCVTGSEYNTTSTVANGCMWLGTTN